MFSVFLASFCSLCSHKKAVILLGLGRAASVICHRQNSTSSLARRSAVLTLSPNTLHILGKSALFTFCSGSPRTPGCGSMQSWGRPFGRCSSRRRSSGRGSSRLGLACFDFFGCFGRFQKKFAERKATEAFGSPYLGQAISPGSHLQ